MAAKGRTDNRACPCKIDPPHLSQSLACLGRCAIHEREQLGHHASLMLPAGIPAGAHGINLVQEDDHGLPLSCLCLCCLESLP